jgi:hypothetical protein
MKQTLSLALMLGCLCHGAFAASNAEIEKAFAKAQKHGAIAVYHDRCHGDGTSSGGLVFEDNSVVGLTKALGALAAQAAIRDQSTGGGCSAGMHPGQDRYYEVFPDGSVKLK